MSKKIKRVLFFYLFHKSFEKFQQFFDRFSDSETIAVQNIK